MPTPLLTRPRKLQPKNTHLKITNLRKHILQWAAVDGYSDYMLAPIFLKVPSNSGYIVQTATSVRLWSTIAGVPRVSLKLLWLSHLVNSFVLHSWVSHRCRCVYSGGTLKPPASLTEAKGYLLHLDELQPLAQGMGRRCLYARVHVFSAMFKAAASLLAFSFGWNERHYSTVNRPI